MCVEACPTEAITMTHLFDGFDRGVKPWVLPDINNRIDAGEIGHVLVIEANFGLPIRAEDGRRVEQVDISAFIGNLPQGRSTSSGVLPLRPPAN